MLFLRSVPLLLLLLWPLLFSVMLPPSTALIAPTALGVLGSLGVLGAIGLIVKKKYQKYFRNNKNNNNNYGDNDGNYGYVQGYFVKGHHGGYGQDGGYDGGYGGGYGNGGSHYGDGGHHGGGSHYGGGGSSYGGGGSHYGGGGSHYGGGSHHGGGSHYGGGGHGHGNHHHGNGILGGGHHHGGDHGGGFRPGFGPGSITPDGPSQNGLFPSPNLATVGGLRPGGNTIGGFASPLIDANFIASRQQPTTSNAASEVESLGSSSVSSQDSSTALAALTSGSAQTVPSLVFRPMPRELESNLISSFSPRSATHIRKRRSLKNALNKSIISSGNKSLHPWRFSTQWQPLHRPAETATKTARLNDYSQFQWPKTQVVDNYKYNHEGNNNNDSDNNNNHTNNDNDVEGDNNDADDDDKDADDDDKDSQLLLTLEASDREGCLSLLRCELHLIDPSRRNPVEQLVLELLSVPVVDDTASEKPSASRDEFKHLASSTSPSNVVHGAGSSSESRSTAATGPSEGFPEDLASNNANASGFLTEESFKELDCKDRFRTCPWKTEEMLQLIVLMAGVH